MPDPTVGLRGGSRWWLFRTPTGWGVSPTPPNPEWTATHFEVMPVAEHDEEVEHLRRAVGIAQEAWAAAEEELSALRKAADAGVGRGTEYVGPLGEYIAANLREVLKVIPDTGDWHALVRWACDKALGDGSAQGPNQTAEWYREAIRNA